MLKPIQYCSTFHSCFIPCLEWTCMKPDSRIWQHVAANQLPSCRRVNCSICKTRLRNLSNSSALFDTDRLIGTFYTSTSSIINIPWYHVHKIVCHTEHFGALSAPCARPHMPSFSKSSAWRGGGDPESTSVQTRHTWCWNQWTPSLASEVAAAQAVTPMSGKWKWRKWVQFSGKSAKASACLETSPPVP